MQFVQIRYSHKVCKMLLPELNYKNVKFCVCLVKRGVQYTMSLIQTLQLGPNGDQIITLSLQ